MSYGAKVKVSGRRAAVVGTKWSKVVQIKKHGENVYRVTATKKGYTCSGREQPIFIILRFSFSPCFCFFF